MKILEIYKNINRDHKCDEIHVEGFTPEQIYFQIEPLCNIIIDEHQDFINRMHKIFESIIEKDEKIVDNAGGLNLKDIESENVLNLEKNEKLESEESFIGEDFSISDSTIIEECSDHESFSDCSSEDEETHSSNDVEVEDIDEIKNQPANELFKVLDKNIRKSKNK